MLPVTRRKNLGKSVSRGVQLKFWWILIRRFYYGLLPPIYPQIEGDCEFSRWKIADFLKISILHLKFLLLYSLLSISIFNFSLYLCINCNCFNIETTLNFKLLNLFIKCNYNVELRTYFSKSKWGVQDNICSVKKQKQDFFSIFKFRKIQLFLSNYLILNFQREKKISPFSRLSNPNYMSKIVRRIKFPRYLLQ